MILFTFLSSVFCFLITSTEDFFLLEEDLDLVDFFTLFWLDSRSLALRLLRDYYLGYLN